MEKRKATIMSAKIDIYFVVLADSMERFIKILLMLKGVL
jgi:hypothetical protein